MSLFTRCDTMSWTLRAVIFGVLVFQNVLARLVTIAWVFGIFAVLAGILSIALAFRVRDFGTRIDAVS